MTTCPHCHKNIKGRSHAQHRRYFAIMKLAFDNWPESHEFQPDDADHLRKWLQVKAGYRTVQDIDIARTDPRSLTIMQATLTAAMKATGDYAWIKPHGKRMYVIASKSIAFDKMGPAEFGALCDDVARVIEQETGIKADDLMKEVEAA